MGILADALAISIGCLLGSLFKNKFSFKNNTTFAIGVMLISIVGLFENIMAVSDGGIRGEHTVTVVIALVLGCLIGDKLRLDERLSALGKSKNSETNGFIDATLFFGIGGLQISGPILLALEGDSFQLILKAVIDLPFAMMMGATYGKRTVLSSIPVALLQAGIAGAALLAGDFISSEVLKQLCSIGYIILFFTGFNMVSGTQNKVKNINMIPGILLIVIYNIIKEAIGL